MIVDEDAPGNRALSTSLFKDVDAQRPNKTRVLAQND